MIQSLAQNEDQVRTIKPRSMFAHYKDYLNFLVRMSSSGRSTQKSEKHVKNPRGRRASPKKSNAAHYHTRRQS
jgi:hypothetical protein